MNYSVLSSTSGRNYNAIRWFTHPSSTLRGGAQSYPAPRPERYLPCYAPRCWNPVQYRVGRACKRWTNSWTAGTQTISTIESASSRWKSFLHAARLLLRNITRLGAGKRGLWIEKKSRRCWKRTLWSARTDLQKLTRMSRWINGVDDCGDAEMWKYS